MNVGYIVATGALAAGYGGRSPLVRTLWVVARACESEQTANAIVACEFLIWILHFIWLT